MRIAALLAVIAVAAGCGQSTGASVEHPATFPPDDPGSSSDVTATGGMPSQSEATRIVQGLWTEREDVISRQDAAGFRSFETGAAQAIDSSYVRFVLCGCNDAKAGHTLERVISFVPQSSVDDAFVAEVKTRNTTSNDRPWYILGVRRSHGEWKIAFITFAGYKAKPPIDVPIPDTGFVAPETRSTSARLTHMATFAANYANSKIKANMTTSYGARLHSRILVRPQADGVFGADLGKGLLLGCYTIHQVLRYSLDGGLSQDAGRHNWGPYLAPGAYRTITTDTAQSFCDLGDPTRNVRVAQYDSQQIAATGARLGV